MENLIRTKFGTVVPQGNVFWAFLLVAFWFGKSSAGEIRVRVQDVFSNDPIAGATVSVRERAIETAADGEQRLLGIEEGRPVGTTVTRVNGEASLEVMEAGLYVVDISKESYETQIDSMVWVTEGQGTSVIVMLVPAYLTEQQAELLQERQEVMKEPVDQRPVVQEGDLRALAVTVPDEVRVENLNGFTGIMNFDEFIGGVVTAEMNDGFPREALRAQAVASRTYALQRYRSRGFANGGQAYSSVLGNLSRSAALFTSKQVILYNGTVPVAYFSARCNGDFTLNSEDGPTLNRCNVGGLGAGSVPYCRSRPCSGHINCSQTSELCCEVTVNNELNYIYGHGVGMCQRGAQQFAARDGWSYHRILTNFYTNVTLQKATNSLELKIVTQESSTAGEPTVLLEVRSGQPNTSFDLERTSGLASGTWISLAAERGLSTGASGLVQVEPQGIVTTATYYRAVLRE
jgi:hypothetical protein